MPVTLSPSESYRITVRVDIQNKPRMLGKRTTTIGDAGGDIGVVVMSVVEKGTEVSHAACRTKVARRASRSFSKIRLE
jgi:hypothetical protein